jgi:hypothetical protein
MLQATRSELSHLHQMIMGFRLTRLLHAAATLRIADLLASTPLSASQIKERCGGHAESLYRLMRALASIGVLSESPDHRFSLTPTGQYLRSDAQPSLRDLAILYGEPWMWNAYHGLLDSFRTGEPAFERVHGARFFDFLAENEGAAARFNAAMTARSGQENAALLEAYDFSGCHLVVDVGGGHGRLLAGILQANAAATGILFDLPSVVAGAQKLLDELAVHDRCSIVAGDFFEFVPAGGDLYLLKNIVHDWDGAQVATLLRNCRASVPQHGRLLVIERVIGGVGEPSEAKLFDIAMLALLGGRERTAHEYRQLLHASGFQLERVIPTRCAHSIIEAIPAP